MNDYDFLNLSCLEFENISRDLLQKKYNIFIESFTNGGDQGIDFRFAFSNNSKAIIQAKRYKKYSDLKYALKREYKKVKKNDPSLYILTTSVGLSPKNKEEIINLFNPYIKSTDDILGRDDLNNLIGEYPEIEKKYFKLWLSSIEILHKIMHSKIYNQSSFELEKIKETLKLYVQNDSFNIAFDILKNNHYVIISGIPGIGKTTLARMLVFRLLAKEFDEFIFLSQSINDGYEYFEDSKKQVFFFDDFLGKNFLEIKPNINEDNKIIQFIDKIKKSKNKYFILTTREYILNQAKNIFESLHNPSIELSKCILDLSCYTRLIKAEIFYNHLFFANVPNEYLSDLISSKIYLKIIDHNNYNPRIIETIIQIEIWHNFKIKDFSNNLLLFFDNPISVWYHCFENTITKESQITLIILLTLGTPVLLEDLKDAINSFLAENSNLYNFRIDSIEFEKIIKELENTFVISNMDSYNKIAIQFQNPSIQDFLVNYLSNKKELIINLIKSFTFMEQFFKIFTFDTNYKNQYNKIKVLLEIDILDFYCNKLVSNFHTFKNSTLYRHNFHTTKKFRWIKNNINIYYFLTQIHDQLGSLNKEIIKNLLISEFQRNINPQVGEYSERYAYLQLLRNIDLSKLKFKATTIISSFANQVFTVDTLVDLGNINDIFPREFKAYIKKNEFKNKLKKIIKDDIENCSFGNYEELVYDLEEVESKFEVDLKKEIKYLNSKFEDILEEAEDRAIEDITDYKYKVDFYPVEKEEIIINNMFSSLIE
ncbi:MAG: AAA family ATPase [Spirochaetia bacterium]|nr:AAA family ATPase [Spirochaetia bacterium]